MPAPLVIEHFDVIEQLHLRFAAAVEPISQSSLAYGLLWSEWCRRPTSGQRRFSAMASASCSRLCPLAAPRSAQATLSLLLTLQLTVRLNLPADAAQSDHPPTRLSDLRKPLLDVPVAYHAWAPESRVYAKALRVVRRVLDGRTTRQRQ